MTKIPTIREMEELLLRDSKTADLIDFYTKELVQELKANGVADAAVWGYQVEALIDPKEMVEVRHRLKRLLTSIYINLKTKGCLN